MTAPEQLIAEAQAAGVSIFRAGDRLRLRAPGPPDDDLRRRIREATAELLPLVPELSPGVAAPTDPAEELRARRGELLDELQEAERWCRDPRPDLEEDSEVWDRLLPAAYRVDGDDAGGLFGALHGMRCCGARLREDRRGRWRLEPLLDPTERLSIWQERSAWDLDCDRWLKPHLPELRRLLSELAEASAPQSLPEPSAPRRA